MNMWQKAAIRFQQQRLAYAKKMQSLIVKWKLLPHEQRDFDHQMIEHHCRPSDWMQGAIGIICLPPGQGQADGGWHIVFWQSETEWDRSLAIDFCPYCGQALKETE